MGIVVTNRINTFDGGIADDARAANSNEFAIAQNFDIYSKRHKLIPYRDMEAEAGSMAQYAIKSVVLFTDSAGAQNLFALGNVSGQTYPQILEKSVNIVTGTFATSTTGASASGSVIATSLVGYDKTHKLYNIKTSGGNTIVGSYDPNTNTYVETVGTITGTSSTSVYPKPFRHPLDDILYFAAGNVVASLNNVTFTASAITVPTGFVITSLCDYGIYLAITCAPIDQGGKSVCFLWGRDTSLTTFDDSIDLGEGAAMIGENVGGVLVFISNVSQSGGSVIDIAPKVTFRSYSGGTARPFKTIKWTGTGTPTTLLKNFKAKKDEYLFFACKQFIENKTVNQLWVCGRNAQGQFFVTPDRLINNDTALTGNVDGFSIVGDYLWAGYNGDGSLKRTDDTTNYTATCIYETPIFAGGQTAGGGYYGDPSMMKDLKWVTVTYEPLATAGVVTVKYRIDAETSFSTIASDSVDNSLAHQAVSIESSSTVLPVDFKEIAFQITSTGGGVPTSVSFKMDITDKRPSD